MSSRTLKDLVVDNRATVKVICSDGTSISMKWLKFAEVAADLRLENPKKNLPDLEKAKLGLKKPSDPCLSPENKDKDRSEVSGGFGSLAPTMTPAKLGLLKPLVAAYRNALPDQVLEAFEQEQKARESKKKKSKSKSKSAKPAAKTEPAAKKRALAVRNSRPMKVKKAAR